MNNGIKLKFTDILLIFGLIFIGIYFGNLQDIPFCRFLGILFVFPFGLMCIIKNIQPYIRDEFIRILLNLVAFVCLLSILWFTLAVYVNKDSFYDQYREPNPVKYPSLETYVSGLNYLTDKARV